VSDVAEVPYRATLLACLGDAQRIGAIGRGSLDAQLAHAAGYFAPWPLPVRARVIDLGSGGGIPALPLALAHPETTWTLVEAWTRRAVLLRRFVAELGLGGRVEVLAERAEHVGRTSARGTADIVTARSFGPPAVTLECAAPLLRVGGRAVLSVREEEPSWPADVLVGLGLSPVTSEWHEGRFAYRSVVAISGCPERFPRRVGQPERRPLF